MSYKVLFFNSQSLYGFSSVFNEERAAEQAAQWYRELHYNNKSSVIYDDLPELKPRPKAKK
jgi:hypothetical protein